MAQCPHLVEGSGTRAGKLSHIKKSFHILGQSGFVGRKLFQYLLHYKDKLNVSGQSLNKLDLTSQANATRLKASFNEQTTLIVLAAVKRQFGDTIETFYANTSIVSTICRALMVTPVRRVVLVSSAAVYGEDIAHEIINENTPLMPRTFYGMAKYNAEWLFRQVVENGGAQSLCIIRPPTIYGPGDTSLSYGPPQFVDLALKNKPIILWGDGSELREFVYIEDAVQAIAQLAQSDFDGTVNLAVGQSHSFSDMLEVIERLAGRSLAITFRPRSKDKVDHRFDNARLKSLVPDFGFTPLDRGIAELYKAMSDSQTSAKKT